MLKLRNVLGIAAMLFLGAGVSQAAIITLETFQLTSDHCTGNCLPSGTTSAGTITVTDNGTGTLAFNITLNAGFQFREHRGLKRTGFGFNLFGNPTITYSGVTSGFAATGGSPQSLGTTHGRHGLLRVWT